MARELDFILSLVDNVTRPLRAVQGGVTSFANSSQQAFRRIGVGSVALWGVGQAMGGLLEPARDMNRALGEVKSLGVDTKSLGMLRDESLKFSMQYGESAQDFVRSSYDIQSAIAGLTGKELATFTTASNVLAKATKSDAATITNYVGTMYGIFQDQANAMGNGAWVDQLAGQTATAVQMFKTTGSEMSGGFTALGASAKSAGAGIAEQMAVLGTLQATMSGSEAGTKYKAFLAGVGGAQKTLGLNFTDSQGKMLGVVQILEKIRGKYGDLSKVVDSDTLKKAFGSDEAVAMIKLMVGNIDGLKTNINAIGDVKGLDHARVMAESMIDPFDRLTKYFEAMKIIIGSTLLPILFPFMGAIADTGATMVRWQKLFPGLTRAVGLLAAGLLFFAAAGAIANITMGISKFIWIGLKGIWAAGTAVLKSYTIAIWLWNAALKATRIVTLALSISTFTLGTAVNSVLWPVLLIIAAVAALAVGAWYLYKHWDEVKASIADSQAFTSLMGVIDTVSGYFSRAWESIANGWKWLTDQFSGVSIIEGFTRITSGVASLFTSMWNGIKNMFATTWNWIADKLNALPGISIDAIQSMPVQSLCSCPGSSPAGPVTVPPVIAPVALTGGIPENLPRGGLSREMRGGPQTTDNRQQIGAVNISVQNMPTPAQLQEWEALKG